MDLKHKNEVIGIQKFENNFRKFIIFYNSFNEEKGFFVAACVLNNLFISLFEHNRNACPQNITKWQTVRYISM